MSNLFGSCAPSPDALDMIVAACAGDHIEKPLHDPLACSCTGPQSVRLETGLLPHWPPRDQFGRGTCVAFATLAAVELHHAFQEDMPPERLSEAYLHARMTRAHPLTGPEAAGIPEGSVLLRQALLALEADGVVASEHMPYKPQVPWMPDAITDPAPDLVALGQVNRIRCLAYGTIGAPESLDPARVERIEPGHQTAQRIFEFLRAGLPVVVGVPLFEHASGLSNWVLPEALRTGIVHCPEDAHAPQLDGPRTDGHVVCITGFEPDEAEPLGGWFVFRNSWGLEFAAQSGTARPGQNAMPRGFGMLSATHLNSYCWEYLVPAPERANPLT